MAEAKSFKDLPLLYNKGASSALRANTYPDDARDVIPITHAPNTTEQQDYAVPLSQIGVSTVGTCDTSADTQTKVVDVISGSFPFNTENSDEAIGRNILVKFTNGNIAENPKIKIGNIEAKEIVCIGGTATVGSGCWEAGATMKFTFDGENWLMHSNVAQKTKDYTILADGTTIYTKPQIDNNVVKYTSQTLSDNQKTQARSNINACSNSDSRLSNSRTPTAHNQASNTINAMTGYSKPSSTSAIATTDTLNSAIGKLEKALENSSKGTVTSVAVKMNGATKGTVTSSGTIDLGTVLTAHQSLDGYIKESAKSIGKSGYLKLTNGLIIQWGIVDGGSDVQDRTYTVTFNTKAQFTHIPVISVTPVRQEDSNIGWISEGSKNLTTTGFVVRFRGDSGAEKHRYCHWFAIGY